jgi:hypothetical protein
MRFPAPQVTSGLERFRTPKMLKKGEVVWNASV